MHDSMALVSFVTAIAIGIYSIFLRSQISGLQDTNKVVSGLSREVEAVQSQRNEDDVKAKADAAKREEIGRALSALAERVAKLEQRVDHAASREAMQGIRGDLREVRAKIEAMPEAQFYADLSATLKALTSSVAALERRVERQDEYLHKLRSAS